MKDVTLCPKCNSDQVGKYGKTSAGLQKFRCLEQGCGRQFVAGSQHRISTATKIFVLNLLKQGVHPKKIHTAILAAQGEADGTSSRGISLRWIFQLRKGMHDRDR